MFEIIINKLEKIKKLLYDEIELQKTRDLYRQRLLSQLTSRRRKTKRYHPSYYEYRKKFGYVNLHHNYYFTGKLMRTLEVFKENKFIIVSSSAQYLSYLSSGIVGGKYFPIVEEAFRLDDLVSIISSEIASYIKSNL